MSGLQKNIRLLSLTLFAGLLIGCFSDKRVDSINELLEAGLLSQEHTVLVNYYVSGWDFFRNIGFIETGGKVKTKCDKSYRAHLNINADIIESEFEKSQAPNKSFSPVKKYPIDVGHVYRVCEIILRKEQQQWFGLLILDDHLIYFENSSVPHDPPSGFRFLNLMVERNR